jgi:hypothetical protein
MSSKQMVDRCAFYIYGMEAIRIPPPSVLLNSPPRKATAKPVAVRNQPRQRLAKPEPSVTAAVSRPKQSKSRNGTMIFGYFSVSTHLVYSSF